MPTPTKKSLALKKLVFPSGTQVYDALMVKIEPELLHANLKKLDAPYKNETPAERAARYKRYSKAFTEYKKAFNDWTKKMNKAVSVYKTALLKSIEAASHTQRHAALQELDKQLQSS